MELYVNQVKKYQRKYEIGIVGGGDGYQIKNTMNQFLVKYTGQYHIIHMGYQLAIRKC
jgi:hypothetical protein